MKKKLTSVSALFLAAAVLVTTFATSSAITPVKVNAAAAKPVKVTMINRLPATHVVEDNPLYVELGKKTNSIIEVEAPPINNYAERLNIVMASGDLPDIIFLNNTGVIYNTWAKDGLLLQLDSYLPKMKNVTKVLTEDELALVRVESMKNGLYSIPRLQTKPWDNIIYRKDWLDKVGKSVPTNPKEFADVMLAFTKNDPDGNGKNDTFGFSYNYPMGNMNRNLIHGFDLRPVTVPQDDGSYQIMQQQKGYMPYMDWLADMYKNGSLDPEWYLTKMYEDDDKFAAAKFGAIYTSKVTNHVIPSQAFMDANPKYEFAVGAPLRPEGTKITNNYYNPQVWGNWGVNVDSKVKDKAIEIIDYGFTSEAVHMFYNGIEGITYTSFDPKTKFVERATQQVKDNNTKYASSYASFNSQLADKSLPNTGGTTKEENAFWNKCFDMVGNQMVLIPYMPTGMVPGLNEISTKLVDTNAKYDEMFTKYVCGQIKRDEFVKYINDVYIPAHKPYIEAVTKAALNKNVNKERK